MNRKGRRLFHLFVILYKSKWQIEIFFQEIKQLLHIKSFIGTSKNSVMIQLWTAKIHPYPKSIKKYG